MQVALLDVDMIAFIFLAGIFFIRHSWYFSNERWLLIAKATIPATAYRLCKTVQAGGCQQ